MTQDIYPSRIESRPGYRPRRDPVLHRPWREGDGLTREEAQSYEQNGFLLRENVLSSEEVETLRREATRLKASSASLERETVIIEPGAEGDAVRSVFRLHRQSEIFAQLASDERLAAIASEVLDDDVYLHQSRLNFKPGFEGKEFYWHSDFETWHVEDGMPRMRALSMSVLLDENTVLNGATMFVRGSHSRYVTCVGETPEDHYKASLRKQEYGVPDRDILSALAEAGVAMPIGPAGSIVMFDCNTMHGSNSNITPFARSNAFFVFNAVSNRLEAPFGPEKPRPEFIAARRDTQIIVPRRAGISKIAA